MHLFNYNSNNYMIWDYILSNFCIIVIFVNSIEEKRKFGILLYKV